MEITKTVQDILTTSPARVLASRDETGVNAVPISMVRANERDIWICNFFMEKTVENVQNNPYVSLVAWNGANGMQVKGRVEYITEGEVFEEARAWVEETNPARTLKGLLVLTPTGVFDVSIDKIYSQEELGME
jgi:Predicted flavin-nucleotide-binding protein structurally related to pyridoxine 5''-phosphate oxidase